MPLSRKNGYALLIALGTLVAFSPLLRNDFVSCDDGTYVTGNLHVRAGLTPGGLAWAWSSFEAANYHPLTWISHMLDVQLFGLRPWGHHLTSLLLHTASALALFLLFERTTGECGRSALVAALFALHPLHVESVAWVAERKDVLCGFFYVLTLLAYARYAEAPGWKRSLGVWLLLVLALLAKPMAVTLPFVLLLLDLWPLGRFESVGFPRLLLEKLPLLPPVIASCVLTLLAQTRGGALSSLQDFTLPARVANALVACGAYLVDSLLPRRLSFFYPHPVTPSLARAGIALLALGLVTLFALRERKRRAYLLVGWLWYLGTLVPVSGLVQVGVQARADRYTYIPLIGVFVMLSWGMAEILDRRVPGATPARLGALVILLPLAVLTQRQVRLWRDSTTLYRHAFAATHGNALVAYFIGRTYDQEHRDEEAIAWYARVLSASPDYVLGRIRMGRVLVRTGRLDAALAELTRALAAAPGSALAHASLGAALAAEGRNAEAIARFEEALRLDPGAAEARTMLGLALARQGELDAALLHLRRAVAQAPGDADARENLAFVLYLRGEYARAWDEIRVVRELGTDPQETLLRLLRAKLPEP